MIQHLSLLREKRKTKNSWTVGNVESIERKAHILKMQHSLLLITFSRSADVRYIDQILVVFIRFGCTIHKNKSQYFHFCAFFWVVVPHLMFFLRTGLLIYRKPIINKIYQVKIKESRFCNIDFLSPPTPPPPLHPHHHPPPPPSSPQLPVHKPEKKYIFQELIFW